MATTAEGRAATVAHRRLQLRLAALTAAEMQALWRLIDPEDLDRTVPAWLAASLRLIRQRNLSSAQIADRYFREFRIAETGQPLAGTLPRPGLSNDAVRTSLLVTGPFRLRHSLALGRTMGDASGSALAASTAAAMRHSLNGGRGVLTGAVLQDRQALGWARVTSAKPCAFCALLAARGPTFKTAQTAGFVAHDSCRCTAEPVYDSESEWPGDARQWADLYAAQAQGRPDPANAFRRAYETTIQAG